MYPGHVLRARFFFPPISMPGSLRPACVIMLCWHLTGCATGRLTVPIMSPLAAPPGLSVSWSEPFDTLDSTRWHEVELQRHTQYRVVELEGRHCLQAISDNAASILLTPLRADPRSSERLSWQWRVDQLVSGEDLNRKQGSDAAARMYVYFETPGLPWQKRHLDYVWSASLPVGTILTSRFSSNSKIIVVESGREFLGQWRTEERNLAEDYARSFGAGRRPPIVAIGVMSDTDNTHSRARAYFDELRIERLVLATADGVR